MNGTRRVLYIRTDGQLAKRLEAVASNMREHRPGSLVSQSSVVRELLHAALADRRMLRRLGLSGDES